MMHEWGFGYGFARGPLGMLVLALLIVIPIWRISEKAGFPGIVALLIFVPLVNIIFIYWLAFADLPSLRPKKSDGN